MVKVFHPMKIGTLTLHLPFNYGNALQMFSLHKYLLEQGYDAEILSHWFYKSQDEIWMWHNFIEKSWKNKLRFVLACCTWTGVFCQYLREIKFRKWHDSMIRWSKEEGAASVFPAEAISHDVVIVGSDQIWNPKYKTSEFFLLPDFPDHIKKVAYAASLGSDLFPYEKRDFYAKTLSRFAAVSVRESSAVDILKRECSCNATLVADPTLLHTRDEWCRLLGVKEPTREKEFYMLYSVTPDGVAHWRELARLARRAGKRIHVYAFSSTCVNVSLKRPMQAAFTAVKTIVKRIWLWLSGVRLHFSATPTEFVQRVADCSGLFTDSFHGMMFATIFGKECNVMIGEHEERRQMSARLRNFTNDFGNTEILTATFDPAAMRRLSITPKLQELIAYSKDWLTRSIEEC